MPQFSQNDINDAKRRVIEMRRKAQNYTSGENEKPLQNVGDTFDDLSKEKASGNESANDDKSAFDLFKRDNEANDGDSFSLLLALILILTKEGADNMLILALLYILL